MPTARDSKSALIVEDASIVRSMLNKILSEDGFVCSEAGSGEEAIKAYRTQPTDIVTLDIHIDGLSGMSVLQVLRTIDPNARIIVVSVEGDRAFIEEAIRQGAKAFVAKPFLPETLRDAITRAFE